MRDPRTQAARGSALPVPAHILMSADDPVIPLEAFHGLSLPAHARLEILPWGGHCAFLEGRGPAGYAENWLAARLAGDDAPPVAPGLS